MFRVDASELRTLGQQLVARSAALGSIMGAQMTAAVLQIQEAGVEAIRNVTPVRSGRLQQSTVGQSEIQATGGAVMSTTLIRQPAETQPDQSGRWGGKHYVRWVVNGRAEIRPPFAFKKALFWPGAAHPMTQGVAAAAPNPYPDRALPEIRTAAMAIEARFGRDVWRTFLGDL